MTSCTKTLNCNISSLDNNTEVVAIDIIAVVVVVFVVVDVVFFLYFIFFYFFFVVDVDVFIYF